MVGHGEKIDRFLRSVSYGVVGASTNRDKYGNKVLRCYIQNGHTVFPVNPTAETIEGIKTIASVDLLPDEVKSISVITPPKITEQVVEAAAKRGIENIWMQPGAESRTAIEACDKYGINCIGDGTCLLVVLGYRE